MPKVPHFYLWIDGEAHAGNSNFEVRNPYDDVCVASVSMAGHDEVVQAVESSRKAFRNLNTMSRYERARLLRNIATGIGEASEEIIDALILEGGKPRTFAEQELQRTLAVFNWAAGEAERFDGECIPLDGMQRGIAYQGYTRREAIGPILGICPFNFPLNLVAHKVAPALAVGNSILIKPARKTPISALILGRIVSEAGAPAGSMNVLPIPHNEVAGMLASNEIRMLSFTGGADVGWALKKQASRQRVTLELGGNSGTIIDASVDIPFAAARCALGGFAQAGQSCIAVQRIFVQLTIFDEFITKLITETEKLAVGDPRQPDTVVGPLISSFAVERVMNEIEKARHKGAKIIHGGRRCGFGIGNIIEPTILSNVNESMDICAKEIFGPVITVTPFEELDTAIGWVNHSGFGLQSAIFSNNFRHIQKAICMLRTGGVVVNDFPTYRVDQMPYGGIKASGQGREGIRSAMLEMSAEKMVVIHNS